MDDSQYLRQKTPNINIQFTWEGETHTMDASGQITIESGYGQPTLLSIHEAIVNNYKVEKMATTEVLPAKQMKKLGFYSRNNNKDWRYSELIDPDVSFSITVNKTSGEYTTEVMNLAFGQYEHYMGMTPAYRDYYVAKINLTLHRLKTAGLNIEHNHNEYGSK